MQKLSTKSIDKFYKSSSVVHQESDKIGFAFLDFSMIFYEFSKSQQKGFII
jgi:hypothetical protein